MKLTRKAVVASVVVVAAGVGVAFATAAIPGSNGTIDGCYAKSDGKLRVIDTEAGKACTSKELALQWNREGAPGERGVIGPQGPKGDPGSEGSNTMYLFRGGVGTTLPVQGGFTKLAEGVLPPGQYLITANAHFSAPEAGPSTMLCSLVYDNANSTGNPGTNRYVSVTEGSYETLTFFYRLNATSQTTIRLECSAESRNNPVMQDGHSLVAEIAAQKAQAILP